MAESGLHASIWAPKNYGDVRYDLRSGDWHCPSCGFSNFQRRTECFRCSSKGKGLSEASTNGYGPPNTILKSENMRPPKTAGAYGDAGRTGSEEPFWQKENYTTRHTPQLQSGEKGLATSRWAPRNYNGRAKEADRGEIWTRTVSVSNAVPARSRSVPLTAPSPPDLGLPYEVQHFVLAMIERIIEEGCYDFASRWIPDKLYEKNWTCAEQVELSTWKKFLPTALPPKAISPVPNYSLERALTDAVRIRNSAVHRHLCDNAELRRMAIQARDLMSMFSDVTRYHKFHRLWEELQLWDSGLQHDPQAKRNRLENALREISERPLDDMDWTPNEVSLQEVTSRSETPQPYEPEEYIDQMELD